MLFERNNNQRNNSKSVIFLLLCITILLKVEIHSQIIPYENGIVASAHSLASQAGIEILKSGGNAVDAAVATAFVLNVVEPYASGIAGGGFITLKMADIPEAITIDYREEAPSKATEEFYYTSENSFKELTNLGPNSVGVPGVLKGLGLALEKYGTMNYAEVMAPAIKIAREGYVVNKTTSDLILEKYDRVSYMSSTEELFLKNGFPSNEGDTLYNKDLAKVFEEISKQGIKYFYSGELCDKIVDCMNVDEAGITKKDLKEYEAKLKNPIIGFYKGYKIVSSAPPSGGGTHLIQLLGMLDKLNISSYKHNSAEYLHLFAEAIKIIGVEKARNMGDPDYYKVPVEELVSDEYINNLVKKIDMKKVYSDSLYFFGRNSESGSTTHISVIDKDRNLVSLTQSLNLFFGSGITVPETGVLLNNHLGNFDEKPDQINSIEPGKRPVSSIAPTIVYKDDKPFLTIGTPGGSRIIGALAQILVNIIDFNMPLDEAINKPRIHATTSTVHIEGGISEEVISVLEQLGHKTELHPELDKYFGGAHAVMIVDGLLYGSADLRRGGVAIGY